MTEGEVLGKVKWCYESNFLAVCFKIKYFFNKCAHNHLKDKAK
jgi:hypothetical protein